MAAQERLIIFLVRKERAQRRFCGKFGLFADPLIGCFQIHLFLCVVGCAQRNEHQRIRRASAFTAQGIVEGFSQLRKEGQRTAQIDDVSFNGVSLCQSCDGLIHNGIENAGGNILFPSALI